MFLALSALLVVVPPALWAVATYRRLIGLRNQKANGWNQLEVQLKRRGDLIPELAGAVEAAEGGTAAWRDALTKVVEARARAVTAAGPADAAREEGELSRAVARLFATVENDRMKANDKVVWLREELSSAERRIGFARRFYNDAAARYNASVRAFPASLLAHSLGFEAAEPFEAVSPAGQCTRRSQSLARPPL
jgi:LemA protein